MTHENQAPGRAATVPDSGREVAEPLLAEDVLLALFQPSSGTVAGETTLYSVLGGAVLTDLALRGLIRAEGDSAHRVSAFGDAPDDDALRPAWDYVAAKPRDAQTVIAATGPVLREQILDRLVVRGDLQRTRKRILGILPSETLTLASGRRDDLLSRMRRVLVDEAPADPRTAAIAALVSASGQLHQLDPEIPWTSPVIHRAKELENGTWGAAAAGTAVTLTTIAYINGALAASSAAGAANGR